MILRLDERVKRLSYTDIKLCEVAVFFAAIMVVKFFPQLLKMNYLTLDVILTACWARPFYKFWIKGSA